MPTALLTGDGYTKAHLQSLKDLGYMVIQRSSVTSAELAALLAHVSVYVLGGNEYVDASAVADAKDLQLISFVGTGYGSFIDVDAVTARGTQIVNTPGINAQAVAEHAIGLLLGALRGLFSYNEAVKRGGLVTFTKGLSASRVGIVGMGTIGRLVTSILVSSFKCNVSYWNRHRKLDVEEELGVTYRDLDDLFRTCDAVILLVALAKETEMLVNSSLLVQARPDLALINVASASLVDPVALLAALKDRRISTAAFDGYWIEPVPMPEDDPLELLRLPDAQFVITPHVAAKTEAWSRMIQAAVDNVLHFSGVRQ